MIRYCEEQYGYIFRESKTIGTVDASAIVDWHPIDYDTIVLIMNDGSVKKYCDRFNSSIYIYRPENHAMYQQRLDKLYYSDYPEETEWRGKFVNKLNSIIARENYTRVFIAHLTGISEWTMNKYGRAFSDARYTDQITTPSLYNTVKIATVLKTPLSDFYVPCDPVIDIYSFKHKDEYDNIIDELKNMYPNMMEQAIRWYVGKSEMTVKLHDGTYWAFDYYDFSKTLIYDPRMELKHNFEGKYYDRYEDYIIDFMSEDEWRRKFSFIFRQLLWDRGITQTELSKIVGVTQAMMNRYLTGKATPSLYIATKIARGLDCPLTKFHII